jgi:hypothetical protein
LERAKKGKARSLANTVIELYNDLRVAKEQGDRAEESVARLNNTRPDILRKPLGNNTFTLPFPEGLCKSAKAHWAVLFGVQQRYRTYVHIWTDTALVLGKAPPFGFPCAID